MPSIDAPFVYAHHVKLPRLTELVGSHPVAWLSRGAIGIICTACCSCAPALTSCTLEIMYGRARARCPSTDCLDTVLLQPRVVTSGCVGWYHCVSQMYSDILRSKRTLGWRTVLIVPELQHEVHENPANEAEQCT